MAIRLEKGQRINLEKDNGAKLQSICVGVNWGAIKKKNWLGFTTTEAVDLVPVVLSLMLKVISLTKFGLDISLLMMGQSNIVAMI